MEIVKKKNKRTGLIVSILVHAVLLLLFAFFGLTYLEPPPPEEGITINFGTTDMGKMSQNNAPPTEVIEENQPPEPEVNEPVPVESVEEEIVTQNTVDAPSIDKKEEEKKKEEVVEPKEEEKKPDPKVMDALDKWKNSQSQASGGGDGTTEQSGDQGSLDGDKNSNNYTGGGAGNGTTFSLAGRSMLSSPKIHDQSQEEGKVVVDIIVDRKGNVVRAIPGARGSNTASSLLYEKAKKAALNTRFSANPDAAIEQKGQMTFIFILN